MHASTRFDLFLWKWKVYSVCLQKSGLLIFRGKKQNFAGFSGANLRKNWPMSWDFRGKKVKIRGKISRYRVILAEKSQILKDFQGQILRKIGRFHGGKLCQETISQKTADFAGFFWANFAKIDQFCVDITSVVLLTGIIICSFNNSSLEEWANA